MRTSPVCYAGLSVIHNVIRSMYVSYNKGPGEVPVHVDVQECGCDETRALRT